MLDKESILNVEHLLDLGNHEENISNVVLVQRWLKTSSLNNLICLNKKLFILNFNHSEKNGKHS